MSKLDRVETRRQLLKELVTISGLTALAAGCSVTTENPSPTQIVPATEIPVSTPVASAAPTVEPIPTLLPSPTAKPAIPTVVLYSPTVVQPLSPTIAAKFKGTWEIQSVDTMKETKDRIGNERTDDFIKNYLDLVVELGAAYFALDTPLENVHGNDSLNYTEKWVRFGRERGLLIYHRHPSLTFEGIYNSQKDSGIDYSALYANYVKTHTSFFKAGDIYSLPEPQNGGIGGNCQIKPCIFANNQEFNQNLVDWITQCKAAFQSIGLGGKVRVGLFGFDGFITAGLSYTDSLSEGKTIIDQKTMQAMANILAVDHYPKTPSLMKHDMDVIRRVWPSAKLFQGEWGASHGESITQMRQVLEAIRGDLGLNYWTMGVDGEEALISEDPQKANHFIKRPYFYEIQAWFKGQR